MGEVIYIASGKGGTGKSAFAVNIAAFLAKEGNSVILVDMAMGQGSLDLYLGLHNNVVYNVYDVLTGLCKVRQAMIRDKRFPGLFLMAAPPHANDGKVDREHISLLYEALSSKFDYVIVDGPSGTGEDMVSASYGTDRAILVTTGDYAGIRGAETSDMALRNEGINDIRYIINRVDESHTEAAGYPSLDEIGRMLRGRIIGVIPEDDTIEVSLNMGIPAVLAEGTIIAKDMSRIAKRIAGKQ